MATEVDFLNGTFKSVIIYTRPISKQKTITSNTSAGYEFPTRPRVESEEVYDVSDSSSLYFIFVFKDDHPLSRYTVHADSAIGPTLTPVAAKPLDPTFTKEVDVTPDRKGVLLGMASEHAAQASDLVSLLPPSAGGPPPPREEEHEDPDHVPQP